MPNLGSRNDKQQWPPEKRGPRRPNANRGANKQAEGHKIQKRRRDSRGNPPPGAMHDCTAKAAHAARQRPKPKTLGD